MSDQAAKRVRWPWLMFAFLLSASIGSFWLRFDWRASSWLDRAAMPICSVGLIGVVLYAIRNKRFAGNFWLAFRWLFIAVVILQTFAHAVEAAQQRGFSIGGTTALVVVVAVAVGWIYVLQWIAMTRLAGAK